MRNVWAKDNTLDYKLLCIDIETRPHEDAEKYLSEYKELKAPSNYKNPEAIEKYLDNRRKEELRKAGLHIPTARVWAICIFDHISRRMHRFIDKDEKALLDDCFSVIANRYEKHVLYGFNSRHFDFPMLIGAAIRNGVPLPVQLQNPSLQSDVLDSFGHMKVKLADLAYCMNSEKLMEGSSVADEWARYCLGEYDAADKVLNYCEMDVKITYEFVERFLDDTYH